MSYVNDISVVVLTEFSWISYFVSRQLVIIHSYPADKSVQQPEKEKK